jgi:hypothetical protein
MAKLYPPIIENVLPAFCLERANGKPVGASIKINFELNRAVAEADVKGVVLRLRTISTNKYIVTEEDCFDYVPDIVAGTANFHIYNNKTALDMLKVGQYYKAQIAFISVSDEIGYFSSIGVIKCIAQPSAEIANYSLSDLNIFTPEIIGRYIQDTSTGDSSEKAYSYRF